MSKRKRLEKKGSYSPVTVRLPDKWLNLANLFSRDNPGASWSVKLYVLLSNLLSTDSFPQYVEKYWIAITCNPVLNFDLSRLIAIKSGACPSDDEVEAIALATASPVDALVELRSKTFDNAEIVSANALNSSGNSLVHKRVSAILVKVIRGQEEIDIEEETILANLDGLTEEDIQFFKERQSYAIGSGEEGSVQSQVDY